MQVREQTLGDAVQAIYESQRAGLLQHAASSFEQAVGAGNWRGAEASLFMLGVAAPAVMRRQLVRSPERFLNTPASKAEGLTAEGLAAEQALGRQLLTQLFGLIGAGVNSPIASMLAQPALAAAAARLTAGYARWLAAEAADEMLVCPSRAIPTALTLKVPKSFRPVDQNALKLQTLRTSQVGVFSTIVAILKAAATDPTACSGGTVSQGLTDG